MVIRWSDEDSVFVVSLPEFHHCKTHGVTYEEAAKNGRDVIDLLIRSYREAGRALPRPLKHQDQVPA